MNKVLFFGNDLDHTLINPNQLRHNGFQVFDNPYDFEPSRQMGIVLNETDRVPFHSEGTTIYFYSRYPTDNDINTLPHVVLTSDIPWDPSGVAMTGGTTVDRFLQKVSSLAFHGSLRDHNRYETDRVAYCMFGDTNQLQLERIVNSVRVKTEPQWATISNCTAPPDTPNTHLNISPRFGGWASELRKTFLPK